MLVVCATMTSCDDFDDIVERGEQHLDILQHFSEFFHVIPCPRWLRDLVNRIDPILFQPCFTSWVAAICRTGTSSSPSTERGNGLKALHTLSVYATTARLTLAQLGVPAKTNEITAVSSASRPTRRIRPMQKY
jgi:hypothetical protein